MRAVLAAVAAFVLAGALPAFADCAPADIAELCKIAQDVREDNPAFGAPDEWTDAAMAMRADRQRSRRIRARRLLDQTAAPTWRDLVNAGYAISYGETPEERLLALGIAIRALSLAPNETSARALVAMTTDTIARNYVGAQLYGRQKFFKMNPETSAVELMCLPQMLEPGLPASVGLAFDAPPKGFLPCPEGVGEVPRAESIPAQR
jgi:hypothetical protein